MDEQIGKDLRYFQENPVSLTDLETFYQQKAGKLSLVKYTICNNAVTVHSELVRRHQTKERIQRYESVLKLLCQTKGLPDTTLLISVGDGLNAKEERPIFGMCKMDSDRVILLPDYESLGSRYQVLKYDGIDITRQDFSWENKIPQLIWRGSTAQHFHKMNAKTMLRNTRITLCKLSEMYPTLLDAKFTLFVQQADKFPELYRYVGTHVSFLDQTKYKYHILIDGNVSPYTKSGWKFFTHSLLFKPDSKWVQWYFGALEPNVHYVPVKEDLSDLVGKLQWAIAHDEEASQIAGQCREFALTHLTREHGLAYLYRLIECYTESVFR